MQTSVKAKEKGERKSRALPQSPSATAPSRREPLTVRIFSFVPQRKQREFSGPQKQKSAHFSSAAVQSRCREPSSGRKVSRESVTKGARGTSNQQKAAVLRLRQFSQSLKTSNSRRDFALSELIHFLFQNFCNNFKFEKFECLALSFSRLRRQLPLGGTSVCACFFSVRKGEILQNFGKYQKRFSELHRTHFCGDLMRHCGSLTS